MPHLARVVATVGIAVTALLGSTPAHADIAPSTQLLVPNLVQSGVPMTLIAEVTQDAALGAPSGSVTFATGYGSTIGTATLVASTAGSARASLSWTPPPEFSVPLLARFTPAGSTTVASTSAIARPMITSAPVPVALRFTQTPTLGPITLEAVLGPAFGAGSVTFFVDGVGWTGSVLTVNGVATVTWNATAGVHTILAQYSSSAKNPGGFSVSSGSSTQAVEVLPQG